jgi:hypothetical protein
MPVGSGYSSKPLDQSRHAPRRGNSLTCVTGNLRLPDRWSQVPRYHFHLRDDLSVVDHEGLELPGVGAARARAEEYARAMTAASVLEHGRINLNHRIEVTNEAGQDILSVKFGDVVTIES